MTFQADPNTIHWKLHFRSAPQRVYAALTQDKLRSRYWAEQTTESDGSIDYQFLNGIQSRGQIIDSVPDKYFQVTYFDWLVTFELEGDGAGGTDLHMTCEQVPETQRQEAIAGWVSWLMTMKAAVDFEVDLRNHDPKRTWFDGYADN